MYKQNVAVVTMSVIICEHSGSFGAALKVYNYVGENKTEMHTQRAVSHIQGNYRKWQI